MTIHWKLLREQPSDNDKRWWRDQCQYANNHGDHCSGYLGLDGDPHSFCQVCDRHYGFDDYRSERTRRAAARGR